MSKSVPQRTQERRRSVPANQGSEVHQHGGDSGDEGELLGLSATELEISISDGEVKIYGYHLIRKDRSRKGGGVCIFLRSSINYQNRSDLVPNDLEGVCLEIFKPNSKPFVIASIYRPPDCSSDFFY